MRYRPPSRGGRRSTPTRSRPSRPSRGGRVRYSPSRRFRPRLRYQRGASSGISKESILRGGSGSNTLRGGSGRDRISKASSFPIPSFSGIERRFSNWRNRFVNRGKSQQPASPNIPVPRPRPSDLGGSRYAPRTSIRPRARPYAPRTSIRPRARPSNIPVPQPRPSDLGGSQYAPRTSIRPKARPSNVPVPQPRPQTPSSSGTPASGPGSDGYNLIRSQEIGSESRYIDHPVVPPVGRSGATIGIGYDLGQHTRQQIQQDWQGILPQSTINQLLPEAGKQRGAAQAILPRVTIPYNAAIQEFNQRSLPDYTGQARRYIGPTRWNALDPQEQGALVDLTYNRGPGSLSGIRRDLANGDPSGVVGDLHQMSVDTRNSGLSHRRQLEADLFCQGLRAQGQSC